MMRICIQTSILDNNKHISKQIATHSTGMLWRDLHKIATIFYMPPPVQGMPPRYAIRLEAVTMSAVKVSMLEAADQLHKRIDSEASPEPKAVNVPISFDSSWKTGGYYSDIVFSAAISTSTKKVLDYEILSSGASRGGHGGATFELKTFQLFSTTI